MSQPEFDYHDIFPQQKKRNPWVAVGALATAGVLVSGLVAFRQGNQRVSQSMMRWRVVAQGATVALMLGSWMSMMAEEKKNQAAGTTPEKQ